jgi:hypothetical protein
VEAENMVSNGRIGAPRRRKQQYYVSMKPKNSCAGVLELKQSGVSIWQAEETARSGREAYRARYEEYVQECGGSSI